MGVRVRISEVAIQCLSLIRAGSLSLGSNPDQFESLDYYRDGLRGLSLVRTSAGGPSNQHKQTWQEFIEVTGVSVKPVRSPVVANKQVR